MMEYTRLTSKILPLSVVRTIKHEDYYYRLRELEDKIESGEIIEKQDAINIVQDESQISERTLTSTPKLRYYLGNVIERLRGFKNKK